MFNTLLKSFSSKTHSTVEAEAIRQQLQSIFFKIKTYQKYLKLDKKLNFKVTDTSISTNSDETSGQITYFIGAYAIRYELDNIKSIQIYKRGQIDNLQFAELLAISFLKRIEYISDELFVKADIYQIEILINHVVKNRNN